MPADAAPLTRDDLRDELNRAFAHYATKADLADVRDQLRGAMAPYATKADLTELRDELRVEFNRTLTHYATRADVADLRADLHALEARLIKWMLGLMLSATGLAVAIAIAVDRLWT
ncbi:MAG: hypothetical protein OXG64_08315 [Chloroflexi bacterium]|nr:hypothetical protein [Chloroflexota bacterium]